MFVTREAVPANHPFIYSSFLNELRKSYPANQIPSRIYVKQQHDVVEFLLAHSTTMVISYPEDPSVLVGYVVYDQLPEALVLHWVCVDGDHRRKHHAAELIAYALGERKLVIATHVVDKFSILKHKIPGCSVIYDPYFIANERIRHARGGYRVPLDQMPGAS